MTQLKMLSTDDKLAEIRALYFKTSKQTIQKDFAKALDLLKSMESEDDRERATVFMDGLAEMQRDWTKVKATGAGRAGKAAGTAAARKAGGAGRAGGTAKKSGGPGRPGKPATAKGAGRAGKAGGAAAKPGTARPGRTGRAAKPGPKT